MFSRSPEKKCLYFSESIKNFGSMEENTLLVLMFEKSKIKRKSKIDLFLTKKSSTVDFCNK